MLSGLSKFFKATKKAQDKVDKRINTVYHGTNAELTQDTIEPRNKSGSDFGTGIYWTSDPDIAKHYGQNLYQADVNFKNPLILENRYQINGIYDELIDKKQKGEIGDLELSEYLMSQGYDGIIVKDARMGEDAEYGKKIPFFVSLDKTSHSNFEVAKPKYGSEAFINDPQRAYTLEEAYGLEPPNRNQLSDAAHDFRGMEGFMLNPYTKQNITDQEFDEGLLKMAEPLGDVRTKEYYDNRKKREVISEKLINNMPSQGLIDRMEGSKYTLERPLYVYRNRGYRHDAPEPIEVESGNLYSTKMVDPNSPDFVDKMGKEVDNYGMFDSMPYIIRLDKGTEVYHPTGLADDGEMVIKGSIIDDSQKFKLDEFLQMNPEDIKKGTDWFSSLGLMNNIA